MKLFVANHKMNLTLPEIQEYLTRLDEIKPRGVKLVICPSYPYLPLFTGSSYLLGSQNVSELESGSLTGEVSAKQLSFLRVKYVIVGHSERREILKESEEQIRVKLKQTIKAGMKPILCIGETLHDYERNQTLIVLKKQLDNAFSELSESERQKVVIAYEPIWAIGTGKTPTNEEIERTVHAIKKEISNAYQLELPVLYGGSVNQENIVHLEKISNLDGYLVGGASLKLTAVKEMIETMEEVL